nr:PQQ-dependent sugar dehydrogenase [Qipengyuania thermophila]
MRTQVVGTFDEPWAAAFAPGTQTLFITEKRGAIRAVDTRTGRTITVPGAPQVDYGGQGGLGDIAFLPGEAAATLGTRTIYLSWAEAGAGDTRGAVVGRGQLVCASDTACRVENLAVIWRQKPKVTGRGHYSHRIAVSPDERHLFVASGDRQKMDPAQDNGNTLGTIVRLNLDGTPAAGNPFAGRGSPTDQIWSFGHRNTLGLAFDADGRLWNMEHGPAGGDEINIVQPGANYGWPVASNGEHYDGRPIPDHAPGDGFVAPVLTWTPATAPGNMILYRGTLFPGWQGHALLPGLRSEALIRVAITGTSAVEAARFPMNRRLRELVEAPDGALWLLEDGENARLLRLTPG